MVALLTALALGAASITPIHSRPDADPAIWVVNDDDTVIFLFGTFHALDGKSDWFNDEVQTAFASADELVLETVIPGRRDRPANELPAVQSMRSLSIAPSASFLASTRVAAAAGRIQGMRVAHGADSILRDAAEAVGKPIDGLESFDQQLGMMATLPGPAAAASAAAVNPAAMSALAAVMGRMQTAWNQGQQGVLVAMLDQMRRTSPQSYEAMFTRRNSNWASWIAERLQRPGTVFVAVGAAHLAGPDCVQAKLSRIGVRSARIN